MRISRLLAIVPMVLLTATAAPAQGFEASPDTVAAIQQSDLRAFDTVFLVNKTPATLQVDSITIRFLNGGANPRPADFTACKACPPDSIGAYFYGGWLYGSSLSQYLRYLQDSLFLLQDRYGLPVTLSLAPGASTPFAMSFPINCPVCGRPSSFPGATRYAFTFIASEGSRAVVNVEVEHASALIRMEPSPGRTAAGAGRDAAGRSNSGIRRAKFQREPAPGD